MKLKFRFITLGGPREVFYTLEECRGFDLENPSKCAAKLIEDGALEVHFDLPNYGRVTVSRG